MNDATSNHAPIVTAPNVTLVAGTTVHASDLVSFSDPDGDAITAIAVLDGNRDAGSGFWMLHGHALDAGVTQILSAADFAQLEFHVGAAGKVDELMIQVGDGQARSERVPFTVTSVAPPNHAPVVTGGGFSSSHGHITDVTDFVHVTDADGDALQVTFHDGNSDVTSGHFLLNGVVQQSDFTVSAANLGQVKWQAAATAQTTTVDQVTVQASDGTAVSNLLSLNLTTPANQLPVVTASDVTLAPGTVIKVADLIHVSDPDGDTITSFSVIDVDRDVGGHFQLNGQPIAHPEFQDFPASVFANLEYVVGAEGVVDTLKIRAFDGLDQSAFVTFHVTGHTPDLFLI